MEDSRVKSKKDFHIGSLAQGLASPGLNDEALWTSWRPVAETYITKQKSLSLSAFPTEKRRLPTHFNFCGHGVILCRCCVVTGASLVTQTVKNLPQMHKTQV